MIIPVHICSNCRRQVVTRDQRGQASCDGRLYRFEHSTRDGLSTERLVCRSKDGHDMIVRDGVLMYRLDIGDAELCKLTYLPGA